MHLRSTPGEESGQHSVIDTAHGYFDESGGVLTSDKTGVSVVIPKGALKGRTKQEIYFKVCQDNSLIAPLDARKGQLWVVCFSPFYRRFDRVRLVVVAVCAAATLDTLSHLLNHPTQFCQCFPNT